MAEEWKKSPSASVSLCCIVHAADISLSAQYNYLRFSTAEDQQLILPCRLSV